MLSAEIISALSYHSGFNRLIYFIVGALADKETGKHF
jgi:hypothetical protein